MTKYLQKWKSIKKGQIYGYKKVLEFKFRNGSNEYWSVRCLQCGREEVLHIATIRKGRYCSNCRRKLKPYINEAAYIAERKAKKDGN